MLRSSIRTMYRATFPFSIHVLPPGVESIVENAEVDFIDVGQGDAELIQTSDGKHILIDAGPSEAETDLLSYLSNRSVTVLDALIISHPDEDHLGGAEEVLRTLEVRSVYHPGLVKNTSSYRNFIDAALDEGCPVYTSGDVDAGDYLDLSLTEDFRVLSINASAEANDASIVIRMAASSQHVPFHRRHRLRGGEHIMLDVQGRAGCGRAEGSPSWLGILLFDHLPERSNAVNSGHRGRAEQLWASHFHCPGPSERCSRRHRPYRSGRRLRCAFARWGGAVISAFPDASRD